MHNMYDAYATTGIHFEKRRSTGSGTRPPVTASFYRDDNEDDIVINMMKVNEQLEAEAEEEEDLDLDDDKHELTPSMLI